MSIWDFFTETWYNAHTRKCLTDVIYSTQLQSRVKDLFLLNLSFEFSVKHLTNLPNCHASKFQSRTYIWGAMSPFTCIICSFTIRTRTPAHLFIETKTKNLRHWTMIIYLSLVYFIYLNINYLIGVIVTIRFPLQTLVM